MLRPSPTVKWRDMAVTLHPEPREDPGATRKKPAGPLQAQSPSDDESYVPAECSEKDSDGLDFLDAPPPELVGVDGNAFHADDEIDINSSILLDVLSDKPPQASTKTAASSSMRRVREDAPLIPSASEWDMW
jgi:hypothetical protein